LVQLSTADGRPSLEEQLDAVAVASGGSVTLDFTGVGHIHGPGLGKVVGLHCRVAAAGGHLLLQNLGPLIREAFCVTTLDGLLDFSPRP
jgi:anti-anti-sigma regulatory factor